MNQRRRLPRLRNRRVRGRGNSAITAARQVRKYINGGRLRVPNNPRAITYNPWNNLTIQRVVDITKKDNKLPTYTLTLGYLDDILRQIIGYSPAGTTIKNTQNISFQLISISVHEITGQPIGLDLYDNSLEFGIGVVAPLSSVSDYPGRNSWASVKSAFPSVIQRQTFWVNPEVTDTRKTAIAQVVPYAEGKVLITIRLRWQPMLQDDKIGLGNDTANELGIIKCVPYAEQTRERL